MKDGPNIARVAGLIGDPARAEILTALLADRALTATELAAVAGVTKQTVSAHLAKLVDARLLAVEAQGRHRYFRLAGSDVARLLESLMGVAFRTGAVRLVTGPREPALRKARVCYDHLAGELGVLAYDGLVARGWLADRAGSFFLTNAGADGFAAFGIDPGARRARAAHVLPAVPRLGRAPPPSRRRARRGAARPALCAALGAPRRRFARRRLHAARRAAVARGLRRVRQGAALTRA